MAFIEQHEKGCNDLGACVYSGASNYQTDTAQTSVIICCEEVAVVDGFLEIQFVALFIGSLKQRKNFYWSETHSIGKEYSFYKNIVYKYIIIFSYFVKYLNKRRVLESILKFHLTSYITSRWLKGSRWVSISEFFGGTELENDFEKKNTLQHIG